MPSLTDTPVSAADISRLTSADAVAGLLTALGYDTSGRKTLTPQAIGLTPEAAAAFTHIELVSEDAEGFFRVLFCQLRSLTAKSRNDLARVLGKLPTEATAWPNSIHDALAAAGREIDQLRKERHRLSVEFARWLLGALEVDTDRFTGITHIQSAEPDFDEMGWPSFRELLIRNKRACGTAIEAHAGSIERQYFAVAETITRNRKLFSDLDAAIDAVVWQLVGLSANGAICI